MIKTNKLILSVFFMIYFISLISSSSGATTKLLCINNGDKVLFSKCNSLISDRTCTTSQGCRYCVSEISAGVYCPISLNECNGQGFTCQQNFNSNNIPVNQNQTKDTNQNNQIDNTNTNIQTSATNSQGAQGTYKKDSTNNQYPNNQLTNENSRKSVLITGEAILNNKESNKKSDNNSLYSVLTISLIIELFIVTFLFKKLKKSK